MILKIRTVDQIPDSWETFYGLDPLDASDANTDSDEDGWSNLEEYLHVGDPGDNFNIGLVFDVEAKVTLERYYEPERSELPIAAIVDLAKLYPGTSPGRFSFVVKLNGDATWNKAEIPDSCAVAEADPTRLDCGHEFGRYGYTARYISAPLYFDVHSEGPVAVELELTEYPNDSNPDNNTYSTSIEYLDVPYIDLIVSAPERLTAIDGQFHTLEADIDLHTVSLPTDISVQLGYPDGIAIDRADLFSTAYESIVSNCSIDSSYISCELNAIPVKHRATMEVRLRATRPGDHKLTWTASGSIAERNTLDNSAETIIRHVYSVAPLQALIDAATDGSNVSLPAGVYYGSLSGRKKTLNVAGSTSGQPTVLVSLDANQAVITDAGKESTFSHLEYQTTGAPAIARYGRNITLEYSRFSPVPDMPHTISALVNLEENASYRIRNSRIEGWGTGQGSQCRSLFDPGHYTHYYWSQVYLEQNLFLGNNCNVLLPIKAGNAPIYIVQNNTFVNNPNLISITGEKIQSDTHIINNIIVGSDAILEVGEDLYEDALPYVKSGTLVTSKNLVWNSGRGSVLTGDLVARQRISFDYTDLNADPLFLDADTQDYRLAAQSPAIDAGTDPIAYQWLHFDEDYVFSAPPSTHVIQPLDGNGDGIKKFDIGAFEK